MRRAPPSLFCLALLAGVSLALPAGAQSLGGASNSVGSSGSGGSSVGGSGTTGTAGGVTPSLGGASNSVGSSGGVGSSATSTQQRATAGSGTLNPINADAAARTGNVGAATTIGGTGVGGGATGAAGGQAYGQAGAGPASLYRIPRPRVNVDLGAIRAALRMGPNATPDARGF